MMVEMMAWSTREAGWAKAMRWRAVVMPRGFLALCLLTRLLCGCSKGKIPALPLDRDGVSEKSTASEEAVGEMGGRTRTHSSSMPTHAVSEASGHRSTLEPSVEEVILSLKSGSSKAWLRALRRLRLLYGRNRGSAERRALQERFVDMLKHGGPREVSAAINLLIGCGDQEVRELVVGYLGSDDPGIRCEAVRWVLGNHEKSAVPSLLRLLHTEKGRSKADIVRALGFIKDKRATEAVIACLGDDNALMRQRSAEALGKIGDKRAARPLAEGLSREMEYAACTAYVRALGRLKSADGTSALAKALTRKDDLIRRDAAEALGEVGGAAALSPLRQATKDKHAEVRASATEALGKIGDKKAVPFLTALLADTSERVVNSALIALARIGDNRAIPSIKRLGSFRGKIPSTGASSAYTDVQAWALWKLDPETYQKPEIRVIGHW